MIAQPATQPALALTRSADQISRRGRAVTVIVFLIALTLLASLFFSIGARRVNNYFVARGDAGYQAGRYSDAVNSYSWAVRFDPTDAHAVLNRGYARQRLNDNAGALPDFTRYIELRPNDPAGYLARGASAARLGQPGAAQADFSTVLASAPQNQRALVGRARAYAALSQWQAAIADYSALLSLQPNAPIYLRRARAPTAAAIPAAGDGRSGAPARDRVRRTLRRWCCVATCALRASDASGALADLNRAIEIDLKNGGLLGRRGV
ncbi:MAG: tetratricopeptide repeat protein [Kouleothrix sp.]